MKRYRHGELEITPITKVKGKRLSHNILAEGEATGHKHELLGDVELYKDNDTLYFSCKEEGVTLTHPDHETITFPKGDYVVETQREYVVGDEKYRRVVD